VGVLGRGPLTAVAFFTCLLPHEVGHAVAARSQGIRPRGVTLFLFGGVAELGEEPPTARAELIVALAGPVVSLVLATLFGLVAWLGYQQGWAPLAVIALGQLAAINTLVLAFNLVPAFPLDGGRCGRSSGGGRGACGAPPTGPHSWAAPSPGS
jgi:Zn-dependent protease